MLFLRNGLVGKKKKKKRSKRKKIKISRGWDKGKGEDEGERDWTGLGISFGKWTGNEDRNGKAGKRGAVDKFWGKRNGNGGRNGKAGKGEERSQRMTDRERENCRCRQFWQARQGGLCGGPGGKGKKNFVEGLNFGFCQYLLRV